MKKLAAISIMIGMIVYSVVLIVWPVTMFLVPLQGWIIYRLVKEKETSL